MILYERRQKLLEHLKNRKISSVNELSKLLKVSEITIYRDLTSLENDGLVVKVHGGVILAVNDNGNIEKNDQSVNLRLERNRKEKEEIAGKALQLIKDETSIFLDHSSTCIYLAQMLKLKKFVRLVVITNSTRILGELEGHFSIQIISTGGTLQHQWSALIGSYVSDFISKLNFEQIFISCGAVSIERGMMTSFPFVAEIIRKASEVTRKINLLVDSSKFSKVGAFSIMPVSHVSRIITDKKMDSRLAEKYRDLGIELLI